MTQREIDPITIAAIFSSFITLGKGAAGLFTAGIIGNEEKALSGDTIYEKFVIAVKFLPMFVTSLIFRSGKDIYDY